MPPLYRFQPEKRVERLHRRGDRVRAWRMQAAEARREVDRLERAISKWRQYALELQQRINSDQARRLDFSASTFVYGMCAGVAVVCLFMAFVK